jgi:hypothetical protein
LQGTRDYTGREGVMIQKTIAVVPLILSVVVVGLSGVSGVAAARRLTIIQTYATAETANSVEVVWNTNLASDSLLQYSTTYPIPPTAPRLYSASQVTYHDFELSGLTPATLYFYKVTSCLKRECVTATGSFETYPSCPDTVPPIAGNWEKMLSPNVGATVNNELSGIAAVNANDVWAVGWAQDPNGPPYYKRTFIEHFNGTAWKIVPSPNPAGDYQAELFGVSAASAKDVWAVGVSNDGNLPSRILIQHWNGSAWKIVAVPSPDTQLNELRGVAALSANDVWAVGFHAGALAESNIDTLTLHWDGVSWTEVPSPNVLGVANQLFGVAAISTDDVWAVGYAGGTPLALHWNGNTWSLDRLPVGAGLSSDWFNAVSAAASNDVWAVGIGKGFFTNQRFATIRHWDGSRWTEKLCHALSSSNPPPDYEGGGPDTYLSGVAAAASDDVWAVGVRGSGPMILHWDGSAWTTVTHPRAFPNSAALRSVATTTGGIAWSAGIEVKIKDSEARWRTLIDRYMP